MSTYQDLHEIALVMAMQNLYGPQRAPNMYVPRYAMAPTYTVPTFNMFAQGPSQQMCPVCHQHPSAGNGRSRCTECLKCKVCGKTAASHSAYCDACNVQRKIYNCV